MYEREENKFHSKLVSQKPAELSTQNHQWKLGRVGKGLGGI